mgnify:CR=1 FL=1
MWSELLQAGGKSLWREIGETMLKSGASTFVVEGVKAGVDLWKQKRLRREVYDFDQWKKAQEELREPATDVETPAAGVGAAPAVPVVAPVNAEPATETPVEVLPDPPETRPED